MNNRIRKTAFAFIILLISSVTSLVAQNRQGERFYDDARSYARMEMLKEALESYIKAVEADPSYWRYPYMMGEFLIRNNKNSEKMFADSSELWRSALEAYRKAWKAGYDRGISRHKIGQCLYHLGEFDNSYSEFNRSIEMNKSALENATADKVGLLSYQIADSYVWKTKIYDLSRDYRRIFTAAEEALPYDPDNQWLPGLYKRAALNLGHAAFGRADYDEAVRWYEISLTDPISGKRFENMEWDDFPDWRIPTDTLIEVVRHRKSLGTITPELTHNIFIIYISDQEVDFVEEGRPRHVHKTLNKVQINEGRLRLLWLKQIVESLSDGNVSVYFSEYVDSTAYSYSGATRPAWVGNRRIYYDNVENTDTFIRGWAYGEGLGTGGAGWIHIIPEVVFGPIRGGMSLHPEHSHGMWLHEFFHVVERMADINPTHGYYDEPRVNFPLWTGRKNNQLDYFRWHFANTIAPRGWEIMQFRIDSPGRKITAESFEQLMADYGNISMEDRILAREIAVEAEKISSRDPAAAFEAFHRSLELSPYEFRALDGLISHYLKELDLKPARPLAERRAMLMDEYDGPRYMREFDYLYNKIVPLGRVIGSWAPADLSDHEPSFLSWNADSIITGPGKYEVSFYYTHGWKAVDIEKVVLMAEGEEVAADVHAGFSGSRKRDITYTLELKDYDPALQYNISALMKGSGGTDSNGKVFITKAEDR